MVIREERRGMGGDSEAIIIQTMEGCYKELPAARSEDRRRVAFRPAEEICVQVAGEESEAAVREQVELAKIDVLMDEISGLSDEIEALEAGVRYFDLLYGPSSVEKSEPVRLSSDCSSVATTAGSPRLSTRMQEVLAEGCSVVTLSCSSLPSPNTPGATPWDMSWPRARSTSEMSSTTCPPSPALSTVTEMPRDPATPMICDRTTLLFLQQANGFTRASASASSESSMITPSSNASDSCSAGDKSDHDTTASDSTSVHRQVSKHSGASCAGPHCKRQVNAFTGNAHTIAVDEHGQTKLFDQELVSAFLSGAFEVARSLPAHDLNNDKAFERSSSMETIDLSDKACDQQDLVKDSVKCSKGHPVETCERPSRWRCDECRTFCRSPEVKRWRCSDCDFDLCEPCYLAAVAKVAEKENTSVPGSLEERGKVPETREKTISGESVMKKWISSLSVWHLKGFEQELRFRVSDIWKDYDSYNAQFESCLANTDYIFFGLDLDANLRDLDKAFRRLAALMRPDKNGNTKEAKSKFQYLSDRYQALRKKIQGPFSDELNAKQQKAESEEGGAGAEEESDHDNLNRDHHENKIWDLLQAAKVMEQQIQATKLRLMAA